jgi:endonuclease/exonuclease/phosphatase family metal-dependent hydrolase
MEGVVESTVTRQPHASGSQRLWWLLLGPVWLLFVPLWCAWGLGQIHRDQSSEWERFFHLPAPLVAVAGFVLLVLCTVSRHRRLCLVVGLFLAWPLTVVLFYDNHWLRPRVPASDSATTASLRLLDWNVWHGMGGWDKVLATLDRERPDILVLAEYSPSDSKHSQHHLESLKTLLRSWGWSVPHVVPSGSVLIASRFPALNTERLRLPSSDCVLVDFQDDAGTSLRLLVLDLPSGLRAHRDPLLRKVNAIIATTQPDLVVGDFNAVRQATQLQPPPQGYRHAYDAAGSGWSYTWPVPFPMLAIDQCLLGPRIEPLDYTLGTGASDHRWQRLDFRPIRSEHNSAVRVFHVDDH